MSDFTWSELDQRAVNMSKALTADAVENTGSGHPGSAISLAPVVYTLYQRFIKHDPNDPQGRPRPLLSSPAATSPWSSTSSSTCPAMASPSMTSVTSAPSTAS